MANLSIYPPLIIAGTDTGVGKTMLTSLLLAHFQSAGILVHSCKPFCSGERTDATLLWDLENRSRPLDEINPFYFEAPLSPWTAARKEGRFITRAQTVEFLRQRQRACDFLIVEGSGGLLSPLGELFNLADLMPDLSADILLVAPDRLGVLNSTLLNLEVLHRRGIHSIKVALVDHAGSDVSRKTNFDDLCELAAPHPVVRIPFIENYRPEAAFVRETARELAATLDLLWQKKSPGHGAEGSFP